MAVTLLEAAKSSGDDLRRGVVEIYATSTPLLQALPFEDITGAAASFIQEDTPGRVDFRSINEGYTEGSGTVSRITEPLTICGGDVDIDRFLMETGSEGLRTTQEAMKVKRLGHYFTQQFVKGSNATDPEIFNGLQVRLDGTDQEKINATNGAALSLANLDETIDKCDDPTHIIMNKTMARWFIGSTRPAGSAVAGNVMVTVDSLGQEVVRYRGLPFIIVDDNSDIYSTLPFSETEGTSDVCTSIYVVSFGDGMLTGIQNDIPMVDDIGMLQTAPKYRTRVEWYAGICLWHPRSAARLSGITNLAILA